MLPKSSDLREHGRGTSTGILWFLVFGGGSSGSCGFGGVSGASMGQEKCLVGTWKFTDQLGAMDLVLCTDAMELSIQK